MNTAIPAPHSLHAPSHSHRHVRKLTLLTALTLAVTLAPAAVHAQSVVDFTVDPARSMLAVNATNPSFTETGSGGTVLAQANLGPQTSGTTPGNVTTYGGLLSVSSNDLQAPAYLQFNVGTGFGATANVSGSWTPATPSTQSSGPGGSGTFPADYGLTGTSTINSLTVNVAANNLVQSFSSGQLPLTGGATFNLGALALPISLDFGYHSSATGAGVIRGAARSRT